MVLMLVLWLSRPQMVTMNLRASAIVCSLILLALLLIHLHVARGRGITVGLGYIGLAALFHGGLLLPLAVSGEVELFNETDTNWVRSAHMPEAAWLSCIGLLAFTIGYMAMGGPNRMDGREAQSADRSFVRVGNFGLLLLLIGIAAWVWWVYQAGALSFGLSYLDFLARTSGTPLPYAYLAMGVGLPIAATSDGPWRKAMVIFALWSLQAFVLGLRGEVLIPAIAAFIVRSRQRPIRLWPVALAGFAALCIGAFVRSVRVAGLSASTFDIRAFNPLDGLVEMGYSIRPLVVVLQWRHGGEPPVGFGTYWHPIVRPLGFGGPPLQHDEAALSAVVSQRVGAIGGSPIAEAFRSGGPWTAILVMALIGFVCAMLDGSRRTATWNAGIGAVAFVLLLWVRNDFVPVPSQFALALMIVAVASLLTGGDPDRIGSTGRWPPTRHGSQTRRRSRVKTSVMGCKAS